MLQRSPTVKTLTYALLSSLYGFASAHANSQTAASLYYQFEAESQADHRQDIQPHWTAYSLTREAEVVQALVHPGDREQTPESALKYQWYVQPERRYVLWARVLLAQKPVALTAYLAGQQTPVERELDALGHWSWYRIGETQSDAEGWLVWQMQAPKHPIAVDQFALLSRADAHPSQHHQPPPEANRPPLIQLSGDTWLGLSESAQLDADVRDDGLMYGVLSYFWEAVEGPGHVTFSDPYSSITSVSVSRPGHYTLQLNASDGSHRSSQRWTLRALSTPVLKRLIHFKRGHALLEAEHAAHWFGSEQLAEWQHLQTPRAQALVCRALRGCQPLSFAIEFEATGEHALWINAPVRNEPVSLALQIDERNKHTQVIPSSAQLWYPAPQGKSRWLFQIDKPGQYILTLWHQGGGPWLLDRLVVTANPQFPRTLHSGGGDFLHWSEARPHAVSNRLP